MKLRPEFVKSCNGLLVEAREYERLKEEADAYNFLAYTAQLHVIIQSASNRRIRKRYTHPVSRKGLYNSCILEHINSCRMYHQ